MDRCTTSTALEQVSGIKLEPKIEVNDIRDPEHFKQALEKWSIPEVKFNENKLVQKELIVELENKKDGQFNASLNYDVEKMGSFNSLLSTVGPMGALVKIEGNEVMTQVEKNEHDNRWLIKQEELDIIKDENGEDNDSSFSSNCFVEDCTDSRCQQHDHQTHKLKLKKQLPQHKMSQEVNWFECDPKDIDISKCDQCRFRTNQKGYLMTHLLWHRPPEEVAMFKCDQCHFQTIRKAHLSQHLLRHTNIILKCDQCDYQTFDKRNLKRHQLRHRNPEDVVMFKCDQCAFQTNQKAYLTTHIRWHRPSEEGNMFKCDQCDYQTVRRGDLNKHILRHTNLMLKCDHCDYQTIRKDTLTKHGLRHKNPKDVDVVKCD